MTQEILVLLCCLGAAFYLFRRFWRDFRKKEGCRGCGTCASVKTWEKIAATSPQKQSPQ
ncbi:MAG: FeoB-associated Cys-rich membrane protein [Microscillaceae bacterium]|nr:FeoB-associated Cys-rich membrane protein [Microscillaceae bacterium]